MHESTSATLTWFTPETKCMGIPECEELFQKAENRDPFAILEKVKALEGKKDIVRLHFSPGCKKRRDYFNLDDIFDQQPLTILSGTSEPSAAAPKQTKTAWFRAGASSDVKPLLLWNNSLSCKMHFSDHPHNLDDLLQIPILNLESAVRILNMVPTKKVDKTPYEIWHGKAPNWSYLKVWGCEAYVKRDSANKLQQRSVKYGDFFERDLISQEFSGRDYDLEDDHCTLPSENTYEFHNEEKAYMKKVPYASAVGSIMYAVRCTRPDVAFAQNLVSRYHRNPGRLTDDYRSSQTGYGLCLSVEEQLDWKSKKQTTIAMHATQSEYIGLLSFCVRSCIGAL
ncbi:hypothetical protein Tco_0202063 [Tanacetum coccineum]